MQTVSLGRVRYEIIRTFRVISLSKSSWSRTSAFSACRRLASMASLEAIVVHETSGSDEEKREEKTTESLTKGDFNPSRTSECDHGETQVIDHSTQANTYINLHSILLSEATTAESFTDGDTALPYPRDW